MSVGLPMLTVLVPCRNERDHIGGCVGSILGGTYPADRMEVLVVDGMSEDGSRDRVASIAAEDARVRLVDNPARTAPHALNRGLELARGAVIARVDAHTELDARYLERCVTALDEYEADAVGGVMVTQPRTAGVVGRAIGAALSHPFGVGGSGFRTGTTIPRWVDTVFNGCYRREVFERVGRFNPRLTRGQDMEFHRRLTARGGRILLLPDVASRYWARSDLRGFWRHNWQNGVWAVLPFLHVEGSPVGVRHLIPMAFASTVLAGAVVSAFSRVGRFGLTLVVGAYLGAAVVAAADAGGRRRDGAIVPILPFVFGTLHLAYGLGSLWGAVQVAVHRVGLCDHRDPVT